MRILASRPDKAAQMSDEDNSLLIKKLKENLTDNTPGSSQNTTPRSSLSKRGQKNNSTTINKEDEFDSHHRSPTLNHMSISNSTFNGSKSPLDLSLLNKVEMESTIDYALSRNLLNLNSNSNDNQTIKNSLQQSGSGGQSTKFVQFGNTYVHHPSDDSSTQTKTSTTNPTTTSTNSLGNKVVVRSATTLSPIKQQQQQGKSPRSQTSSMSSSKQSSKTSDDFEDDDDEEISIKLNKMNLNNKDDLDLFGSLSKYSSNEFCTETSKSKDIPEEEEEEEEEENYFSRADSRTSTY